MKDDHNRPTLTLDGRYSAEQNTTVIARTMLSYPQGPCERRTDGTWSRRFDGGIVVVNPTQWDATVQLDQMHRDISSGYVDRRFVLPRLDGRIYLRDAGLPRPRTLPPAEPQLTATGPAGVVQRDGNSVLRDGRSAAVLIGPSGDVLSFCVDGQELIDSIATVIVHDDKWQDFETEDLQHEIGSDGSLTLRGKRSYENQALEFTQTVRLTDGRLESKYLWRANTPLELRAFRQHLRLPPRVFGGTKLRAGADQVLLPKKMADGPDLAKGIHSANLPIGEHKSLTIRLPQSAHLVDDRHYNGSGYLLAFYPIAGKVEAGREWSYAIQINVDPADSEDLVDDLARPNDPQSSGSPRRR